MLKAHWCVWREKTTHRLSGLIQQKSCCRTDVWNCWCWLWYVVIFVINIPLFYKYKNVWLQILSTIFSMQHYWIIIYVYKPTCDAYDRNVFRFIPNHMLLHYSAPQCRINTTRHLCWMSKKKIQDAQWHSSGQDSLQTFFKLALTVGHCFPLKLVMWHYLYLTSKGKLFFPRRCYPSNIQLHYRVHNVNIQVLYHPNNSFKLICKMSLSL